LELARAEPAVSVITEFTSIDSDTTGTLVAQRGDRSIPVAPAVYRSERGNGLPSLRRGGLPDSADEVALGGQTATDLGADVGDHVNLLTDDGRSIDLVVTGIVVAWGLDTPATAFVVTDDTLRSAACPAATDTCDFERGIFASTSDSDTWAALTEGGYQTTPVPANVARLDQVGSIPWYLAGFLGVLALAGIAHALASSLRRRRLDLAVVRALGLSGRRAARSLGWQAIIASALGTAAGLVLGIIAGRALWSIVAAALGVLYQPVLPALAVPATVTVALAGALLVSVLPTARARRLRPAEQLRSE
ncbi:MAG TPA: FtsX-like permease family protein, partial [Acidimicrobiales bacterium]